MGDSTSSPRYNARILGRLVVLTLLALVVPGLPHAAAVGTEPTALALTAPATVRRAGVLRLTATLSTTVPAAVPGATVTIEQDTATGWVPVGSGTTGADGRVVVTLTAGTAPSTYRASYAGDGTFAAATSADVPVTPVVVASTVTLGGSAYVVDETSGALKVRWSGADAAPVTGAARLWLHEAGAAWRAGPALTTDAAGNAVVSVRPRVDTWYQVRGSAGAGWAADDSPSWYVHNRRPGQRVVLPSGAPRPQALPAQPRAVGAGASVKVTRIPDAVWGTMVGRSWHPGCPVGRSGLRLIRANYWGFDGYRHRGELVVATGAVGDFTRALRRLSVARVPIRSMYLPDRFGYSSRSGGADDFASMAHDNTSAFNCRWVTGWSGRRSPHSYGRAVDLNPFENPFDSAVGWLPNRWWVGHSNPRYAWRSAKHQVVRIMRSSGFTWTYPRSDPQHFDA